MVYCLSNAMHGQNINLPVCVCVCVSVTLSVNSPTGQTPQRTIKFFSFFFGIFVHAAGHHKQHSLVRRRLCDLHCMVVSNYFCHFVVSTSSNRSIASGAWPTVSYTQLRRR